MAGTDDERVRPMLNPPHLGELIREGMEEVRWTVSETAARLNCERGTLSRVLNGKAGVSVKMALSLEVVDWGTADHWMRMQAAYVLAQARRRDKTRGRGALYVARRAARTRVTVREEEEGCDSDTSGSRNSRGT